MKYNTFMSISNLALPRLAKKKKKGLVILLFKVTCLVGDE